MKKMYNNPIQPSFANLLRGSTIKDNLKIFSGMTEKAVTIITLCCMAITPAFAVTAWTEENCNNKGGQMVTVGGQRFCKSTSTMNWWSAYSWCQAIGGKMPSITELCPNAASITAGGNCAQTYSGSWVWSSTPNGNSGLMWFVNGSMLKGDQGKSLASHYAACCLPNNTSL